MIEGGYSHDDGTWADENTLLVTLIGIPKEDVYEIANDLCTFFRQESVMITLTPVARFFHRERREAGDDEAPGETQEQTAHRHCHEKEKKEK